MSDVFQWFPNNFLSQFLNWFLNRFGNHGQVDYKTIHRMQVGQEKGESQERLCEGRGHACFLHRWEGGGRGGKGRSDGVGATAAASKAVTHERTRMLLRITSSVAL